MGRGPTKLTQRDISRGAKGLTTAGLLVQRMEMVGDGVTQRVIYHCVDKNGGEREVNGNEWERFVRDEKRKNK
jgi:hypothetical protein